LGHLAIAQAGPDRRIGLKIEIEWARRIDVLGRTGLDLQWTT
jgi:hypothetical protein